ncbi:S41 family peptidase [Oscillochloris sp. ZM17-4]|uniref:S41 family peptidase n=1 Tax=Oscillochloris sp. ZM17-4 TaxID=2866714 RepID=UPI001C7368B5|nr:S41 family peptidase [Oscillochloris sp. ZM17-4]MBX0329413.1 S41 family peptidase [Oscillochloris sp. ZM17-4]
MSYPPDSSPLAIVRVRLPLWLVAPLLGVTLFLGIVGGLAAGYVFIRPASCPDTPQVCQEFSAFWDTWKIARNNFVDPQAIDSQKMIDGAINGMLDTLGDQGHTRYLSAEEATSWDESLSGSFEGIGAYIDVRDGQTVIVSPIEGSPAEQAGLRPGDAILAVDDKSTEGWSVQELATNVRGPAGTAVTLRILHVGEETPLDVSITRAKVVVPSVSWRMLPDNVALLRLSSFDRNSGDQMRQALQEAKDKGARAVILDLRNNPGGLLDEAVSVAGQFLPEGTTVLLEANRSGDRTPTKTKGGGVAIDMPLVVLINHNSASSSEILSGALQDAKRATLVGEPTFGTGTVLTPYRIDGGGRLLLGTQQWLTPDGRLIRGQGIAPDEQVDLPVDVAPLSPAEAGDLSLDQLRSGADVQLSRAIDLAAQAASR